ncbi:membrane protein, partial [Candidatus Thiomargarita nelsonii]
MRLINRIILIIVIAYSLKECTLFEGLLAIGGTLIAEILPFLLIWIIGLILAFFLPIGLPVALGG